MVRPGQIHQSAERTVRRLKTLEDFPQFTVATGRLGKTSSQGVTRFELNGEFDGVIEDIDPHWFWLMSGRREHVCATLQSFDKVTRAAILTCDQEEEPKVAGQSLAYLSPRWQAYHAWMVLDPDWGWARKQFQGADAVAQDYDAGETSVVEGRDVRVWTKLELVEGRDSASRHYPALDQSLPPSSDQRLVAGGWGHEHCDLCFMHIDAVQFGYCDPGGRWMCERCYEKYVTQRDLAFVDEL
jgi:hypothetical protein